MSQTASMQTHPPQPEWCQPIDLGTTIMAVEYDGGVVLAADSRTSAGSYIANRVADKLTPITENIYVCRSGSAADTQNISDYTKHYLGQYELEFGEKPPVSVAANIFRRFCYEYKDQLMAGLIVAGYDRFEGGSVYAIPLGGVLLKQPFAIGGSGSTFIYGFCDANYREGMSKEECVDFVSAAVSHAMARDGSSGGCIRIAIITEDGVERKMITNDKLPKHSYEG